MSRIRADKLVNRAGSGGPQFPYGVANGLTVAGVVTATSFSGDGSSLTGIDASALKDGSNVKVQATPTGATVTGTLVADVTGNVTGNATGLSGTPNLNVGIVTATSFSGNGSGLTGLNIPAASDWRDNSLF